MSTQQASSDADIPRLMMERYLDDMGPLSSSSAVDVMQGGVSQSITNVAELMQRQVSMPLGQLCSSSPLGGVFDKSQQSGLNIWDVTQLSEQEGLTTSSDQVEPSVGVIMPVGDLGHTTLSTSGSLGSQEQPSIWERRAVTSLAASHLKQLNPLAVAAAAVGVIPNFQDMTPGGLAAKLEELSSSHGVVLSPGGSSIGNGKRSTTCGQSVELGRVNTAGELQLQALKKFRSGEYSIPSPEMVSLSRSPRHAPSLMRSASGCDIKPFSSVGTTFCTPGAMLEHSASQPEIRRPQSARSLTMPLHVEVATHSPHAPRMHDMSRPTPLLVPHNNNYLSPRQTPVVPPLADDSVHLGFDGHASEMGGGLGRGATVPSLDKGAEWWSEWGEDWRPDGNAGRLLQIRKEMNDVSNSWASADEMAGTPAATPRLMGQAVRNAISDPGRGLSSEAGLTSEDAEHTRGEQKAESGGVQEKKPYKRGACMEPQAIAARDRRGKIAQRLKALQQLVCPSGKGGTDTVTMLEEAIGYVKRLQEQIKDLTSHEEKEAPEEKPKDRVTANGADRERGGAGSPNGSSMKS
uniref:Class VIII bHLH/RSL transcription factor n=1 Tax=Coleochaete nitellarum TaxID=78178 RepID=A0A482A3B6_COLNI|nr:class VIII bHLH/RSL transcription factor [Coleochaete nitellarum]